MMRVPDRCVRTLAMLVEAAVLSACCGLPAAAQEARGEEEVAGVAVVLDAEAQRKLGVMTAAAEAADFQQTEQGSGLVLAVQAIVQAMADLASAEAAARAGAAALTRARGLFEAETAVSREVLESAERQAAVDQAALALAKAEASVAYGSGAPWLDADRRAGILARLIAGRASVIRATFPAGLGGGQVETLRVRPLDRLRADQGREASEVWTGPADPAVPGPTLFAYLDPAEGLVQGDRVIASVATGGAIKGVIVPASAVVIAGGEAWCYVVRDGDHFVRVAITLDRAESGGYFQAPAGATGLKAGTTIVIRGAGLLLARETGGAAEEE